MTEELEQKVERVFTNPENNAVEAVLYRLVSSLGISQGYLLHLVFSDKKIVRSSLDEFREFQTQPHLKYYST